MKKLLLILLALLAFTPPQVQARIRVDRIYGFKVDASGNVLCDLDGELRATESGSGNNKYWMYFTIASNQKTNFVLNTGTRKNITNIKFFPTTAASLNGVAITEEESNEYNSTGAPIILEVDPKYRDNVNYNLASYATDGTTDRGLSVDNSKNGLYLFQNVRFTIKTTDSKYKIHQVFFDAEAFNVTTSVDPAYIGFKNITTMFKPKGAASYGNWLDETSNAVHPDPEKNGAKLTTYQRLFEVTDENASEFEFWSDQFAKPNNDKNNYVVYFSDLIVVWDDGVVEYVPTPPATPKVSPDMNGIDLWADGSTVSYINSYAGALGDGNFHILTGDDDAANTELRYIWDTDTEITYENYLNVTMKYDPTGAECSGIPVSGTTLRVVAVRDGFISEPVTINFNKIEVATFTSLDDLMKAENDGKIVMLNTKLRTRGVLDGANPKVGSAFYDLFAYTGDKAIRVHYFDNTYSPSTPHLNPLTISSVCPPYATWAQDYELTRTGNEVIASPHRYYSLDNKIVGLYRHNGGAAPVIEISSSASNSVNYYTITGKVNYLYNACGDGVPDKNPTDKTIPLVKEVTKVKYLTESDFNHQRILTPARFRNHMFELTGPDGEIQRVKIDDTYSAVANLLKGLTLTEGEYYQVEGMIGASGVNYAVYPLAVSKCPVSPVLLAPNKIDTDAVNMISPSFRITVDAEGADPATEYSYKFEGLVTGSFVDGTLSLEEATDRTKGILVDAARFSGRSCTLTVTSSLNGIESEPVVITITKHSATEYATIAAFKKEYLGKEADLPEVDGDFTGANVHYGRITGNVVIVKKTPEYLYVRDIDKTAGKDEFASENYLLIHNGNGWHNPQIDDNGTERELAEGDVITGFALVPAVSHLKNLISETTGFARTVRYTGSSISTAEIKPEVIIVNNTNESDADYYTNSSKRFDDSSDRMRYYTLKTVQVLRRLRPEATATDDPNAKWIYKLMLGSDKEEEWPELTLNVFTVRDGWAAAFGNDNSTDGLVYPFEITGVAMRNGEAGKFALAMTEFSGSEAPAAPSISLRGSDDNGGSGTAQYVYTGVIDITPADSEDQVWYTTDGSDALQNPERKLYTGSNSDLQLVGAREQVIVSAFSIRPGSSPSPATVRVFERLAVEREFIANILKGSAGQWYHFNGDVRVVAVGPNYMFVRGVLGQYLPIYSADGFEGIEAGKYLTDFIVRHAVSNGNIQVNTTDETVFTPADKGQTDTEIATDAPYEVNSLSKANLRQFVTLRRAQLSADGESWTIKGQDDQASTRRLNIGMAGPMTGDELVDQGVYDITGFVMYGTDGNLELWPVSASAVTTSGSVSAVFSAGTEQSGSGSEINARFYPMSLVTLTAEANNATIYYAIYDEKTTPESAVVWSPYVRPITIVENGRLHAYAAEPGKEPGEHLHINFTLAEMSGDVEFKVREEEGKTFVELTPAGTAPEGTEIQYAIGSYKEDSFIIYKGEFSVDQTSIVYARLKEPGKIAGTISHVLVSVTPAAEETPDPDKISGKVTFSIDDTSDPTKVTVYLAPEEGHAGTIYYLINPTGQVTPENGTRYENPIEMKEGGRIVAILVESGKVAGEPTDIAVWLIPTDIDGIDAEEREGNIRAEGGNIIAPEGSEVFDITGRRVSATGLRAGIYIVRTPGGKAVKVKVD
jgi:hypothetical protein